jgi:hypothetical protein
MSARKPSKLFDRHMGERLSVRAAAACPWRDNLLS